MPLQNKFEHCARNASARSSGARAQKTRLIKFFIESLLLPKYVMLKKARQHPSVWSDSEGCLLFEHAAGGHAFMRGCSKAAAFAKEY